MKLLTDASLGQQVEADVYVSSFRQVVEACFEAAADASDTVTRAARVRMSTSVYLKYFYDYIVFLPAPGINFPGECGFSSASGVILA
ncbi:hypothetical protein ABS772_17735 [Methylorubrum podarium]|uniref:Uncharacterized protein n=1 Tax=Methylorubrum podarium TaxID=200476 RepID=A0ABV1QQS7_9HYPH